MLGRKILKASGVIIISLGLGYLISPLAPRVFPYFVDGVGTGIYEANVAKEKALFTGALLASPAAATIPIPVIGEEKQYIVDTYGAERGSGRSHEGQDIFSNRGRPILASIDGIVLRIGVGNLGGNYVFILGPGGERYYYAHLDEIDPALKVGQRVNPLTLVGTVGTTGNAEGTPPHLHFGVYGEGGDINPYPRLEDR